MDGSEMLVRFLAGALDCAATDGLHIPVLITDPLLSHFAKSGLSLRILRSIIHLTADTSR
jgi:hypothetical protein